MLQGHSCCKATHAGLFTPAQVGFGMGARDSVSILPIEAFAEQLFGAQ
jgi:hypothetical protein